MLNLRRLVLCACLSVWLPATASLAQTSGTSAADAEWIAEAVDATARGSLQAAAYWNHDVEAVRESLTAYCRARGMTLLSEEAPISEPWVCAGSAYATDLFLDAFGIPDPEAAVHLLRFDLHVEEIHNPMLDQFEEDYRVRAGGWLAWQDDAGDLQVQAIDSFEHPEYWKNLHESLSLHAATVEAVFYGASSASAAEQLSSYVCRQTLELVVETQSNTVLICNAPLHEQDPLLREMDSLFDPYIDAPAYLHVLRFDLQPFGGHLRVRVGAWFERSDEQGEPHFQSVSTRAYVQTLRFLMLDLAAGFSFVRVQEMLAPYWPDRYEDQSEWFLAGHLRGTGYCYENFDDIDPAELETHIADAQIVPYQQDVLGRCEAYYEALYLWGEALGIENPRPEDFSEFVRNLPENAAI